MLKGTTHTEETKAKIAASKTGKTFTPEHSQAISAALVGRKKSAAHKKAISEALKVVHARRLAEKAVVPTNTSETVA